MASWASKVRINEACTIEVGDIVSAVYLSRCILGHESSILQTKNNGR